MSKKKVERPQAQSSPKNSRKACLCMSKDDKKTETINKLKDLLK